MVSEWIGGGVGLSHYVTGEGDAPFKPEAFIWLDQNGLIVGTTLFRPGEASSQIAGFFRETTQAARVPARVRVASAELAEVLRREIGGETDVVCAATPELDEPLASLVEHLSDRGDDGPLTYLTAGLTPDAMARLFGAASSFYRAAPWRALAEDAMPARVTIAELDVEGAPITILGALEASFGLVVFPNEAAYEQFLESTVQVISGALEEPPLPPHCHLELVAKKTLAPELTKEISRHRWPVAGAAAYPVVSAVDDEGIVRPVTARELAMLEAIACALAARVVAEESTLTFPVETSHGLVRVAFELGAAGVEDESLEPFTFDIHEDLFDCGELDAERAIVFEDELVRRFAESKEASALDGDPTFWPMAFLELGREQQGITVTQLEPDIVDEIVFEDLPRRVSCDADAAANIVASLRAFFTYLEREYGLAGAGRCAGVVGSGAEAKLRRHLSDPRYFGMAKSLVMGAKEAGFDVRSPDDLKRAMALAMGRKVAAMSAPDVGMSPPTQSPETRAKKKNKRKAERASRRKNRR